MSYSTRHPYKIKPISAEQFGLDRMKKEIAKAKNGNWKERFDAIDAIHNVDHPEVRACILNAAKWDIAYETRRIAYEYACLLKITDNGKPIRFHAMPAVGRVINRDKLRKHALAVRDSMTEDGVDYTDERLLARYTELYPKEWDMIYGLIHNYPKAVTFVLNTLK